MMERPSLSDLLCWYLKVGLCFSAIYVSSWMLVMLVVSVLSL